MKLSLTKELFLEKLQLASRFSSNKISTLSSLQGIFIVGKKDSLHIYASNLTTYFHGIIKTKLEKEIKLVIEPRKIIEFLGLLTTGKVEIEVGEKQLTVSAGKTKGTFPLMSYEDFPLPPTTGEEKQKVAASFLQKNLPLILFSASSDDTRPVLSGINFLTNEDLVIVSTDGFRLSLIRAKKEMGGFSFIVPSEYLTEVVRNIKGEKEIEFGYFKGEKMVVFRIGDSEFFSRLIEGEFPPFERVVPQQRLTKVTLLKEELLTNTKLVSVFARDFSNVIICEFKKTGLSIKPKMQGGEENAAFQEIEFEGEEQKVAFNYKFLLDFLNHVDGKKILVEILRPDAPVVFKLEDNPGFLHIIMPVRLQEE